MPRTPIPTRTCQSALMVISLSLFVPSLAESFHTRLDGTLAWACCAAPVRTLALPAAVPADASRQVPLQAGAQSLTLQTRQRVDEIRQGDRLIGLLLSTEYH